MLYINDFLANWLKLLKSKYLMASKPFFCIFWHPLDYQSINFKEISTKILRIENISVSAISMTHIQNDVIHHMIMKSIIKISKNV